MTRLFNSTLTAKAAVFLGECLEKKWHLVTAESCTGGMIAALMTSIAGSSDVFDQGFVTYAYAAKEKQLGVPKTMLETHGAVSPEVAVAMAEGALRYIEKGISVAVTGVAGPGASEKKPAGLVYIAIASHGKSTLCRKFNFAGGRDDVRLATVIQAIEMLLARVRN